MRRRVQLSLFPFYIIAVSLAACVATRTEDPAGVSQTADRSVGTVGDDAAITAKIKTALISNPTRDTVQINVETREGVVQLSGFVGDSYEKAAAGRLAASIDGVRHVDNALETKRLNP